MRRVFPLLFAASLLLAQTKPPDPAVKASGSIHGVVKDAFSGAPLPECEIRIGKPVVLSGAGFVLSTGGQTIATTDDQGAYTASNVPPGALYVSAGINRGPHISRNVQLSDGQDLAVDFLIPGSPTISGRVLDENDQPAVDAFVYLIQSQYSDGVLFRSRIGPKITGEDGSFIFDKDLEAGRAYYLLVDRDLPDVPNWREPAPPDQREVVEVPTYYGNSTSLEAATPIVLRLGEHHEHSDIKLRKARYYCLDGELQAGGGNRGRGLAISELALASTEISRARIYSAEDGSFGLCGLAPGQYSVSTTSPLSQTTEFTIANADLHHVPFNLDTASLHLSLSWDGDPPPEPQPTALPPARDGVPEATDEQRLARMEQIRRQLLIPRGSEIGISLGPVDSGQMERAPYDGKFKGAVGARDYRLEVRLQEGSYAKEVIYNGVAVTDGLLHVAPGTNGTLRVVASKDAGKVVCQVSDADGNPMPDAIVLLIPQSATSPGQLSMVENQQADQQGNATMNGVAPGKYRVLALTHRYRKTPEDLDKLMPLLFKAQDVEVAPGATINVKLQPTPFESVY